MSDERQQGQATPIAPPLNWLEARLTGLFGPGLNPLYHLGSLTVYLFWIVLVSGIYLFLFYETSLGGAWQSVEGLTVDQPFVGGVMRSLHRYASDAAVLTMLLHLSREFIHGRFRGPRWFSWFTGMPLLWIVMVLGISGYWMVWDQLAQYVAVSTARLFDALPVFTDPMSRNFLDNDSVSNRFFTLIAFIHLVGLPIVLVLAIWFHLLRIRLPRINPPRALMASSMIALLALSAVLPATSHAPADLGIVPDSLQLDWYYLFIYPLLGHVPEGWIWGGLVGLTLLLATLPWLLPAPALAVAVVQLPDCTGCRFCADDCPYGAIDMVPRSDGRAFELEAKVDPDLCVACGICTGSCPSSSPFRRQQPLVSGIELPGLGMEFLKRSIGMAPPPAAGQPTLLIVACEHGAARGASVPEGCTGLTLPCIGMVPPAAIDYALRVAGFDGVVLGGCDQGDCMHRYGDRWTRERVVRQRPPMLRARVPRERLLTCWLKRGERRQWAAQVKTFRDGLAGAAGRSGEESA